MIKTKQELKQWLMYEENFYSAKGIKKFFRSLLIMRSKLYGDFRKD